MSAHLALAANARSSLRTHPVDKCEADERPPVLLLAGAGAVVAAVAPDVGDERVVQEPGRALASFAALLEEAAGELR